MQRSDPSASGSHVDTRCKNCGAFVTPRFVRVFGDNDDTIHRCLECTTFTALRDGAGSRV